LAPQMQMGNRVLREFDSDGTGALRVQFRDDCGTLMRRHFVYLGSSNSQMRDGGCYFYDDGEGGQVQRIRESLGRFTQCSIPKMMSRMGQCFTQARQCAVKLKRANYNKTYDVIGGCDTNGSAYVFSDGVGTISIDFARTIALDLGVENFIPSCFQVRYRGVKGVLTLDPNLDVRKCWAETNRIADNSRYTNRQNNLAVLFRPSQDKFKAPRDTSIEVVKYSAPTPVFLNRPLILILDQVSELVTPL
uniref:RNA-dependent RNA polymerase n=1 Tax=Gongylonema pulchrum TaxID=637853 RepID=A0A183E2Q4_9BILA